MPSDPAPLAQSPTFIIIILLCVVLRAVARRGFSIHAIFHFHKFFDFFTFAVGAGTDAPLLLIVVVVVVAPFVVVVVAIVVVSLHLVVPVRVPPFTLSPPPCGSLRGACENCLFNYSVTFDLLLLLSFSSCCCCCV